jgi:cytochrome c-type biogenesis protein CcmF
MTIGHISILVAFITSLAAAYLFWRTAAVRSNGKGGAVVLGTGGQLGAKLYYVMTVVVALASVLLWYYFLAHRFEFSYVARYSSMAQPLMYLISAFWAGQEGTFLLWALLVSVMGVVYLKRTSSVAAESHLTMALVSAFLAFLYLLMMVKSPFEQLGFTPQDGSGMNPLLQDPWMAIHPPLLFVGYAASVFPFAMVVAALSRRSFGAWINRGFAWSLFATLSLGAGIIIGGFWAYEVLGWGGYWGWDPVENASLVPWLTLLALIHGLFVQKSRGSLVRSNMALAIVSFVLVLYATFLTRSGVLADFSVHSFVNLGINNYLIASIIVALAIGAGLLAMRFREITAPKLDVSSLNRELAVVLGMIALCVGATFTFVGMSSPILTGIVGSPSQVDTGFYNRVNLPVAIIIALLLGVTPFLGWTELKLSDILKRLSLPLGLTVLSLVIAAVAGVDSVSMFVFVGASVFALVSNAIIAFRSYRSGLLSLGGPVAHIGVALMLVGIIGSGRYSSTRTLALTPNQPQNAFGYAFSFNGTEESPGQKTRVLVEVADGNKSFTVTPKLYYSDYNKAMMREPAITILPLHDLYISPVEMKSTEVASHGHPILELTKGETKQMGEYSVQFVRFETGQHGEGHAMAVGAVLNVVAHGHAHEVTPQIVVNERGEQAYIPADFPNDGPTASNVAPSVTLNALNVDQKKIILTIHGLSQGDVVASTMSVPQLIIEVSTKPLMMVLWTGVVLILAGTALSVKRRSTE